MTESATTAFHRLAEVVIDELLAWEPVAATWLGDHRFDARLPDFTSAHLDRCRVRIEEHLTDLDAIDDIELSLADNVDLEILRSALSKFHFEITDLAATTWNPMLWNPGTALHLLLSRDFAPIDVRAESLRGRLREIPRFVDDARSELRDMPGIHVETAILQLQGTLALIGSLVADVVNDPGLIRSAEAAVSGFIDWLGDRLPDSLRSPRLGERLYSAVLWHSLDDAVTAADLLRQAEEYLDLVGDRMVEAAAAYLDEPVTADDLVRRALTRIATDSPVTNDTVLGLVALLLRAGEQLPAGLELLALQVGQFGRLCAALVLEQLHFHLARARLGHLVLLLGLGGRLATQRLVGSDNHGLILRSGIKTKIIKC